MNVDKSVLVLSMLMTLAVSNPVLKNGPDNTIQMVESREQMMIRYRLPSNTVPKIYNIQIEPNMTDFQLKWKGELSVEFEVLEITKILTLHAYKNLIIDEHVTKLVDVNGNKYNPIKQSRNDNLEFFTIEFEADILIGKYTLNIKYEGFDTGDNTGFYKASHPGLPIVAATQFEVTMARRAFPCWDEPALKAQFRVSIKHDKNYTAISNMPMIESVETLDGKNLTKFETTPIMSTYLLTFVIANYTNSSNEHGNVTIWAPKNLMENVQHVLNTSEKVVDIIKSYTGLPFGLPKVGSVVIPIFESQAMENWGLVSYNEDEITFNRTIDKAERLDNINSLIIRELAHSWFGNRVTPLWWNDIWLTKAFVTYFAYYVNDKIHENSNNMELFIVENNQETAFIGEDLIGNVLVRSMPITNSEIEMAFAMHGEYTFPKGAAIIHMFRNVLTDDIFQAGVRKFLTNYSFKAADTNDLIKSFQQAYDENETAAVPLNIHDTMMTWLTQTGYPMINVTRDYTTGSINVDQKNIGVRENNLNKWWIPLNYATKTNLNFESTIPSRWISDNGDVVTIEETNKDDWVIFNVQASGYYRVNYDDKNWRRIIEYLNTDNYNKIHVLNRAQIVSDAAFLAKREPSRYGEIFWNLTNYLSREVDYLPWKTAKRILHSVEFSLRQTEIHENFIQYISGLTNKLIEKVGYDEALEDDDQMTKLSKKNLVPWLCTLGQSKCAENSAQKILRLIENPLVTGSNPDNLRSIICQGLRVLNKTSTQQIFEWTTRNDKSLFEKIVFCTKNRELLKQYLDSKMIETEPNKFYGPFHQIMTSNEENFNFAVDYFITNHVAVNNRFVITTRAGDMNYQIVRGIAYSVKSNSRLEKFKDILKLEAIIANQEIQNGGLLKIATEKATKGTEVVEQLRAIWQQPKVNEK